MTHILILYYSRNGATQALADAIATGVESAGAEALLRTVSGNNDDAASERDIVVNDLDLQHCDGLIVGSPTRFGHMASSLQRFWESTSRDWLKGNLEDKPGAVFTSTGSQHGGQESTLLTLALPLLHHGMLLTGIPYSEPALQQTRDGGSPYGASHVAHDDGASGGKVSLSEHEYRCAKQLGYRVASIAQRLKLSAATSSSLSDS